MIIARGDIYVRIPDRERVAELMRATQARVREQPGCLYYAFAETLDDPGHLVVIQQWRDRDALERHYRSQTFADYQTAIGGHLVRTSELHIHEVDPGVVPFDPAPIDAAQED
jgi:quinol monooxygenase YgiN